MVTFSDGSFAFSWVRGSSGLPGPPVVAARSEGPTKRPSAVGPICWGPPPDGPTNPSAAPEAKAAGWKAETPAFRPGTGFPSYFAPNRTHRCRQFKIYQGPVSGSTLMIPGLHGPLFSPRSCCSRGRTSAKPSVPRGIGPGIASSSVAPCCAVWDCWANCGCGSRSSSILRAASPFKSRRSWAGIANPCPRQSGWHRDVLGYVVFQLR